MKTSHALRAFAALLLVAFQMCLVLPSASAHTKLLESTPAAGESVSSPGTVSLRFDEALRPGSTLTVTGPGPATDTWTAGPATIAGDTLRADLPALGAAGEYTISYRVTSADGHVVTGSTYFTYSGADGAARPAAPPEGAQDSGRGVPALGIVALAGLGAAVGAVALRRRSKP